MNSKQEIYDNISAILAMYKQGLADGYNGNSKQVGGYYHRRLRFVGDIGVVRIYFLPQMLFTFTRKIKFFNPFINS